MKLTYWGVRGSVPVPGPATVRSGGNTSCVALSCRDRLLVIDAGSGIVALGDRLDPEVTEIVLLLTHRHMDHVQGLPFFNPLYGGGPRVTLLDLPLEEGFWSPLSLFDGVAVPIRAEQLDAAVMRAEGDPLKALAERGWDVGSMSLRHPGGSCGYRISNDGRVVAHLTDAELGAVGEDDDYFARCVEFCREVDVLSHDAQYLEAEMQTRRGRGHSSVERVCDLAEAARVGHLVLFHHDPGRDDDALDRIGREAGARLGKRGITCSVAREGMVLEL